MSISDDYVCYEITIECDNTETNTPLTPQQFIEACRPDEKSQQILLALKATDRIEVEGSDIYDTQWRFDGTYLRVCQRVKDSYQRVQE